jgi:hypothetical protein
LPAHARSNWCDRSSARRPRIAIRVAKPA